MPGFVWRELNAGEAFMFLVGAGDGGLVFLENGRTTFNRFLSFNH